MNRRKYLALLSTGVIGGLAGCSFGDDDTPTETPNGTETPTETPNGTDSQDDGPPSGIEQPETMTDIAAFAYNHHQPTLQTLPYTLTVQTEVSGEAGVTTQNYTYKYNGENRSLFGLEINSPNGSGTVEKYSTGGIVYTRTNPANGEITYDSTGVENGIVFRKSGLNQIDQLDQSNVEVGDAEEQEMFVYRYPITAHNAYDSVSGYIELDIQQGVITAVEFEGGSDYSLSMEFDYGGIEFDTPAWVRDMEDNSSE